MKSVIFKGAVLAFTSLFTTLLISAGQNASEPGKTTPNSKALVEEACTRCHPLDMATSVRRSREEWAAIVQRMVNIGLSVEKDDVPKIIDYLATQYGVAPRQATSGSATSPVQPFAQSPVAPFGQTATPFIVPSAPAVGFASTPLVPDGAVLSNGAIVPRSSAAVPNVSYPSAGEWRQWGGPERNFISTATGLADSWPAAGPATLWSRPLGLGHSAIAYDNGVLFTLYRPGTQISRNGPWESRERVVALDAASGKTLWEHEYASEPLNFSYGAGPHATPLVTQNLVFTAGTNKQIHAFDKKTGRIAWSHDLVREFRAPPTLIRPAVKAGYAASPIAYKDMVIVVPGGPGQSVMAFRQQDGALVWKSGDFLTAESAPLLIDVDKQMQLVVVGGQSINGMNPDNGKILWSFAHDTEGDMNNSAPVWGPDNVLIISSAYNQGTRALKLTRDSVTTRVEQVWFNNRFKLMFSNAIRLGDYIYGTHGDFGPAFLAALDVKSGQMLWQQRGFGRSSLIWADGKAIIMDEDGVLKLARLTPQGVTMLASAPIFKTTSWTVPTLIGSTLYARDREKIVALNLGKR